MRLGPVLALLVALATAGAALAAGGDPAKRITPADQARAKSMLLRKGDFGLGFRVTPSTDIGGDLSCPALDESDLTLTGQAQSPTFTGGVEFANSLAQVYESVADSRSSWRRGTSAAGEKCARSELSRGFRKQGAQLDSFRRMSFPRLAEQTVAYRLVVSAQGVPLVLDAVVLRLSRAQAAVILGSGLTPMPRAEEVRLVRIVARRMAAAMRGS